MLALSLLVTCAVSGTSVAQEDDGFCRNGMFAEENSSFGVAKVIGNGRLHFLEDMDGCPNASAACRQRGYVIPGDSVITGRSKGDYVCAYFPNDVGGSAGWVERSRLRPEAIEPEPTLDDWAGKWTHFDNWVEFHAERGVLSVEGEAYWPSANPPLDERPGGPNIGGVGGEVQVKGNRAYEPECAIGFTLLGEYLVVADPERRCDGFNVAFTGVYLRSSDRAGR